MAMLPPSNMTPRVTATKKEVLTFTQALSNVQLQTLLASIRQQNLKLLAGKPLPPPTKPRVVKAACSRIRAVGGRPLARPPPLGNRAAVVASKDRRLKQKQHLNQKPSDNITKMINTSPSSLVVDDEKLAFCEAVMLLKCRLQVV